MNTEKEIEMHKENILTIIENLCKRHLFNYLTKKSSGYFLRGKDIISVNPQVLGIHEEPLTNLIKFYAGKGYKDFLIDIGANIGLTSCQNGGDFAEVHMFEPNPLCCNILEVNASIALDSGKFNIHKYGLGDADKKCSLTVPKHNWGGAFVRDANNSYNDNILASKDGFDAIDSKNYFELDIVIKDTERELKELFESLAKKQSKRGLVKIDVEGYEESVLIGIAKSVPVNIQLVIVFESWDENFNLTKVVDSFQGRCHAKKLNRLVPWKIKSTKIEKILTLLLNPIIKTKITEIDGSGIKGDLILEIN